MRAFAGRDPAIVGKIPRLRESFPRCHIGAIRAISRQPSHSPAVAAEMQNASFPDGVQGPLLDTALAGEIVRDGIARYIVARRERIDPFVASHFSLAGTLRLHRAVLGWDIARPPVNLAMAAPQAGVSLAAAGARRLGAKRLVGVLRSRPLIQRTAVAREVACLNQTELLELPARDGTREARRGALAETIVADLRLITAMRPMIAAIEAFGTDPALRARIETAIVDYAVTRITVAEITTALLSLGTGAAALSKLTRGAMTLGPALATMLAQQAAVASFPLGGAL
jgi:hypothetical protein